MSRSTRAPRRCARGARWRASISSLGATRRRFIAFLGAALLAPCESISAEPFPDSAAVPGGIAKIPLGASDAEPKARVKGNRVLVTREGADWIALVGIALDQKPGSRLRLQVDRGDGTFSLLRIDVGSKQYASQHLRVPQEQVELPAKQLARFAREQSHLRKVLATFSETPPDSLALRQPVPGTRSATFGLRRYFNNEARRPHNGKIGRASCRDREGTQ